MTITLELIIWAKNEPTNLRSLIAIFVKHNHKFIIGTAKEVGRGSDDSITYIWSKLPSLSGYGVLLAPITPL